MHEVLSGGDLTAECKGSIPFSTRLRVRLLRSCTLMYDLYKMTKGEYLKGIKRRVFEVFKDDLEWQTRGGAFKTVDCKKMNQVKLRA